MHALRHVTTSDLMCEMVRRTIANDKAAIPLSLLQLVCAMASMLGTRQCFLISEALRDAADELENPERVHVQ